MDFSTQVEALDKAVLFADCIAALIPGINQAAIDTKIQVATGQPVRSVYIPGTVNCPTYYVGTSDGYGFVFVTGTENLGQATGYWTNLLGGILGSVANPVNGYTERAAIALLAAWNALRGTAAISRVYWCGWSLGGAIANHAASLHAQENFMNTPSSWTIGAPRTLNRRDAEFVSQGESVRWMIDADPVPLIPPSFAQSPATALIYGVRYQQRLNNFVHVAGGREIFPTGTIRSAELPENAVWTTSGTLQQFLFSEDGAFGPLHSIAEYLARFRLWIGAHPRPNRAPPGGAPQEAPNPSPRREETRQATVVRQALVRQGEGQNSIPISVPPNAVFAAVRNEGIWIVSFGGQFVTVGPTKRRARALARLGNEFVKRLLVQAVVAPDVVVGQFQAFLTAAADPTSGIRPTLQTAFPT